MVWKNTKILWNPLHNCQLLGLLTTKMTVWSTNIRRTDFSLVLAESVNQYLQKSFFELWPTFWPPASKLAISHLLFDVWMWNWACLKRYIKLYHILKSDLMNLSKSNHRIHKCCLTTKMTIWSTNIARRDFLVVPSDSVGQYLQKIFFDLWPHFLTHDLSEGHHVDFFRI